MITGEARVTGTIRGHGKNPHGLYPTLDGKMEVLLENGRIFKSQERAVWKIISILNLPAVLQGKVDLEKDGLPYNKISATVLARNGLFETENLIIDSPIVKITAAGNYDLPTDQIDMVWAVSPFGSYAQFLKTIPLFGRLFAGDRKGFATAHVFRQRVNRGSGGDVPADEVVRHRRDGPGATCLRYFEEHGHVADRSDDA